MKITVKLSTTNPTTQPFHPLILKISDDGVFAKYYMNTKNNKI